MKKFPLSIRRNGYTLQIVATEFSRFLYSFPNFPREDEDFLQAYLRPGDTCVDIGANIGTTTLAAAVAVGESGKVYAFEAHPRTFRNMCKSIGLNPELGKRITAYQVALGQKEGEVRFSDSYEHDDVNHVSDEGGVVVPMKALDTLLGTNINHINVIKIDVEGYEKYALEGSLKSLQITDVLYFESAENNFKKFGYSIIDIVNLLESEGFRVFALEQVYRPSQRAELIKIDNKYISTRCENMFAVRDINTILERVDNLYIVPGT